MQPSAIVWRDELPKGPNGKLDRVKLKSELMG
jgi:acyl-coenzyme A synthetase/AMP-(fatty) acid ligase